jgi:antimicrobial peptide system SdpB family protein
MLTAFGARARAWATEIDPFTNVYGLARSILALATALTLLFNAIPTLFRPAVGIDDVPLCAGVRSVGAFCVGAPHLEVVRWLSIVALFVIASGWRPRFTGVLHAWIAFSFQANAISIEGGDQVHAILALLLVPVTLLDDRRWHWSRREKVQSGEREDLRRLVARTCFTLIRLQVAGIYFHAAVAKFAVQEWSDGTVLYYWLNHPSFGAPAWLAPLVRPILLNGMTVALLTWGVLIVEYALSAGLLVARKYWPLLLAMGIALHAGIALLHGLVTFAMTMMAALVLYLRPLDQPFALPQIGLSNHLARWRERTKPIAAALL